MNINGQAVINGSGGLSVINGIRQSGYDNPYLAVVNSLSASVIAYWPGELTGATVNDASGNNRTGTAANTTTEAGLLGDAFRFTGVINSGLRADAGLRGAIDQDEFCVSMIVRDKFRHRNRWRISGAGDGGLVSDIVAWPRTLSGAAVTVLDAAVA